MWFMKSLGGPQSEPTDGGGSASANPDTVEGASASGPRTLERSERVGTAEAKSKPRTQSDLGTEKPKKTRKVKLLVSRGSQTIPIEASEIAKDKLESVESSKVGSESAELPKPKVKTEPDGKETPPEMASEKPLIGEQELGKIDLLADNIHEELDDYFEHFEKFFAINGIGSEDEKDKTHRYDLLAYYIGKEIRKALSFYALEDRNTYEKLKASIYKRFDRPVNAVAARSELYWCVMSSSQTSRDFEAELWHLIKLTTCKDPDEQKLCVLTMFTTRHANPAVIDAFVNKPPRRSKTPLPMLNASRKSKKTCRSYRL